MHSAGHAHDRTLDVEAPEAAARWGSASEFRETDPAAGGEADWRAVAHAWHSASSEPPARGDEARFASLAASTDGALLLENLADEFVRFDSGVGAARSVARLSAALESGELDARVPWRDRVALAVGAGFAPLFPSVAAWLGHRVAWRHLGHLVVGQEGLERRVRELEVIGGIRPVVAPVLTRALGDRHADLQLASVEHAVGEAHAHSVALSLPGLVSLGIGGAGSGARERMLSDVTDRLGTLSRLARATDTELVFEVDRHRDLSFTAATVLRLLEDPQNRQLRVVLTLPVNSDDSFALLPQLTAWVREHSERGGSDVTLRFAHADELREERAIAQSNRWPVRTHSDPAVTLANLQRILDWLLTPERLAGLRVVVASDRAHDHAFAWRLARQRGVLTQLDHEVRLGVSTPLGQTMKRVVGGVRVRVPVVGENAQQRAADYLVRRVRERRDFAGLVQDAVDVPDLEVPPMGPGRVTVADPCTPEGRDWFDSVAKRARAALGSLPVAEAHTDVLQHLERASDAAQSWSQRRAPTRATVLRAAAEAIANARTELVVSAVVESGLTAAEADAEVSAAIWVALSAAGSAEAGALVQNAAFAPVPLVAVLASRTSPIAHPAAQLFGALAAGSAVVVKAAPENRHTVATLVATVRDAGVPAELVVLLEPSEAGAVQQVLESGLIGRVVHAGSRHIAKRLRHDFPDVRLLSSTGGRNAIIVSESAHVERAVEHVVASAFWGAGQGPHTVGTVIVVGEQERFVSLLADAVASLAAGDSRDPSTEVGALVRPASGATLACLRELAEGERWIVAPRRLDEAGRVWSPGLVDGVAPGSARHVTERRAPVLSIVRAESFADAVDIQNGPGFGLVAGLQSADPDELARWLDAADAGGLSVNAPTVGEGWERHSVAGWRRSNVGVSRAPGGRLFLDQFGEWMPVDLEPDESVTLEGMSQEAAALITAAQSALRFDEFDWVRSAARDDERAWGFEFGLEHEAAGSGRDLPITRYRSVPTTVRLAESGSFAQLVRVIAAATRVHAPVAVSVPRPLPEPLIRYFRSSDSPVAEVVVESEQRWLARALAGDIVTERVRLIGDDAAALLRALAQHARVAVISSAVTASGRAELANFVAEQSVRVVTA